MFGLVLFKCFGMSPKAAPGLYLAQCVIHGVGGLVVNSLVLVVSEDISRTLLKPGL